MSSPTDPIVPRTLKGFRDFTPERMMPRERLIDVARRVYRSYGFAPIDTPALEYYEILAGKGSEETDRQMYQFRDHGDRHVGLRFDLTVPLARFIAEHSQELGLPFKRYHIATVWRGEKNQAGRYREFMQCDFDTVGTRSLASDIETVLVINDLMRALGFTRFQIRINNRKVLNGLLDKFGLRQHSVAVLRSIDKLPKIGPAAVRDELSAIAGIEPAAVEQVMQLVQIAGNDNGGILRQLQPLCAGNPLAEAGAAELRQIIDTVAAAGLIEPTIRLDVAIARGLDYYTGTIVETFLDDLPGIGSVCSGGRYDQLATLFTKEDLPGIGASLGLDRLLAAMEELKLLPSSWAPADVLIAQFDSALLPHYFQIAAALRRRGFSAEVYPEPKKVAHQFKYADRRGFQAVILVGSSEVAAQQIKLKWLADGTQHDVTWDADCESLLARLGERLRPHENLPAAASGAT